MLETEGDFQCHMKDCAAIGEGRKLLINEQFCAMEDIVVEDADQCIRGAPHYDAEGAVCANDGTATEAYCSYFVGSKACARCTNPIAAPPKAPADTKHFVTMTVSLPYTKDEFDTAKQDKYKAAVASSAGTRPANVVIISITEERRRAGSVKVETKVGAELDDARSW